MIEPTIHFEKYGPEALRAMDSLERHLFASSLREALLHQVRMRASQINGCRYGLDLHSKDARAVCTERLARDALSLGARAGNALAWTEALTPVAQTHVPDEV
jgi:AhpD family alkylhydroperoxidase